jgi:threonine dehydratase
MNSSTDSNVLVRPTTVIAVPRLARRLGIDFFIASETFQTTGSFKFRAALNLVTCIDHPEVITASSGNFGQALAYACKIVGKACTVVMPATSVKMKVQAVREYGAEVELIDVRLQSREERVREIARERPSAYVASAYDDPLVIEGNSTLGIELANLDSPFSQVVVPIGGGGLAAGIIQGLSKSGTRVGIVGAEPLIANDASQSLRLGRIVRNPKEPETIADGARTISLGQHNWDILRHGLAGIIEVPEEKIIEAVRLLFELANLKAEPTGALSLAALLTKPEMFRGEYVCCVVSGGNVDPDLYAKIVGSNPH